MQNLNVPPGLLPDKVHTLEEANRELETKTHDWYQSQGAQARPRLAPISRPLRDLRARWLGQVGVALVVEC